MDRYEQFFRDLSEQEALDCIKIGMKKLQKKSLQQLRNSMIQDEETDSFLVQIATQIKDYMKREPEIDSVIVPEWTIDLENDHVQVDAFLYDDHDFPTHKCIDCSSLNTKELCHVSHSMDRIQLEWIFETLFSGFDYTNKTVVDVGSRLGAVLYAAHYYTDCKNIIGIEKSAYFCKLQTEIVQLNKLDRIKIENVAVECDSGLEIVANADILILNNVFECFVDGNLGKLQQIWSKLHKTIRKKGAFIVSVPSIEAQLEQAQVDFSIKDWLKPIELTASQSILLQSFDDPELLERIFLYRVVY